MPRKPSEADMYREYARQLTRIDEQIDNLTQARQVIVVELLRIHPDDGKHDAGDIAVKVNRSRRLDLKAVESKYPRDQRPELYDDTPRVTTAKVREHIAPADLEPFLTESAASVKVVDADA